MKRLLVHGRATLQKYFSEDAGQALILAAVLLPVMMLMLGAAVEGGSVMVQYRRMQTAADISALTGAQRLPCGLSDTTCAGTATADACTYAQSNGFGSGVCSSAASDGSLVTASAPPAACSPYNFINYGNKGTDATCSNGSASSANSYIEVNVSKPFQIPIFNVSISLSTHAVAREGVGNLGGFAVYSLSHSVTWDGSSVSAVGSAYGNSSITGVTTCDGAIFGAGSSVSGSTSVSGTPYYSPSSGTFTGNCLGSADTTAGTTSGMPTVPDPYASSQAPPSSFANCSACSQGGWQYDPSQGASGWTQGGSITGSRTGIEVFPGVYTDLSQCNKCNVYFNPGIYTFTTGAISTEHGMTCVFGSPNCDDGGLCESGGSTGTVLAGTTAANQFMYQCSPWGYWDTRTLAGRPTSICATCAPTFYNEAVSGGTSTVQLNGVVLYDKNNQGITMHGNAGGSENGGLYLTAPNPCPGTGTFSATAKTVTFPSGASSASSTTGSYYTYATTDLAYQINSTTHQSPNSANIYFYPSMDYSQVSGMRAQQPHGLPG